MDRPVQVEDRIASDHDLIPLEHRGDGLGLRAREQQRDVGRLQIGAVAGARLGLHRRLVHVAHADRRLDPGLAQQGPAGGGGGREDETQRGRHGVHDSGRPLALLVTDR